MTKLEPTEAKGSGFTDDEMVCFCFQYTKKDIEDDFRDNGCSLIYQRILDAKKSGMCNCAQENPRGR
jgi:hypothetical protein